MIFKNQSLLQIKLNTGVQLAGYTVGIIWKKPSGVVGLWPSIVVEGTKVGYTVQPGDINESGKWEFQAKITMGGRDGYGVPVSVQVQPAIT